MPVRAPTTERSRRTRRELARASRQVLAETGALDAEAVAAGAGVSTATFYAHFESHDDALAAALDLSLEAIVGVAEEHFGIEALLDLGLSAVVADLVVRTHAVFRSESPVLRVALARLAHHQPIRRVYRAHEQRSLEHLARQIELGQKAGLLRGGPSEERAIALLVVLQGIHNPMLTKGPLDDHVAADVNRAVMAVLDQ